MSPKKIGYTFVLIQQKEFYDEQLAQQHAFTLPLQAHSPFDPKTNREYSPATQNKRLMDRNSTLLREVRFADQTCVELSARNAALEKELEQLRKTTDESMQSSGDAEKLAEQLETANDDKQGLERQ